MEHLWDQAAANRYIPERMQGGLKRWICEGIEPGGFLTAVLQNNLFEAVGRADIFNSKIIPDYCEFLWNYAPSACFGSVEEFNKWAEMHRERLRGETHGNE